MNEVLIENWNKKVNRRDDVYFLGDFCFDFREGFEIFNKLNGNVFLVLGNHDRKREIRQFGFVSTFDLLWKRFEDRNIMMCHYAMRVWKNSHHGSWHLYGHSHGTLPENESSFSTDVGVDKWNFSPVCLDQLVELFDSRKDNVELVRKD